MGGGAVPSHPPAEAVLLQLAHRWGGGSMMMVTFGGEEGTAMNQSRGTELKLYPYVTNCDGKFRIF